MAVRMWMVRQNLNREMDLSGNEWIIGTQEFQKHPGLCKEWKKQRSRRAYARTDQKRPVWYIKPLAMESRAFDCRGSKVQTGSQVAWCFSLFLLVALISCRMVSFDCSIMC